jgi:IS5 family transposase
MYTNDATAIFCFVDDFMKALSNHSPYSRVNGKQRPGPRPRMHLSEVVTILLLYQISHYDCFKHFYTEKVLYEYKKDFNVVSYTQFVKLIASTAMILVPLLKYLLAKCSDISFVDSTSIAVCKTYRERRHKTFADIAAKSKTTKGWFFGLKLHMIINASGELIKVCFTPGNRDDRKGLQAMASGLSGKIFADRGYIGKEFAETLAEQGIQLITRLKRGMKNILMPLSDKIMLLRRSLIETVIGKIKLLGRFEHSRHRSVCNAFVHMISTLICYQLDVDKPSISTLI